MHEKSSPTPEQTYPILSSFKDSGVLAAVTEEPDWSHPKASTAPLSCYVRGLSRKVWLLLLASLPWLLDLAEEIALLILQQKELFASADPETRKRAYQQLPRLARRWLAAAFRNPVHSDAHLFHDDVLDGNTMLIRARALPNDDLAHLTSGFASQEVNRLKRLASGEPVLRPSGPSDHAQPEPLLSNAYGRPSYDPTDPLLAAVPNFLNELEDFLSSKEPPSSRRRTARWFLVNALGIYYAVAPDACPHVRINCLGGPISLWPQANKTIRELGGDYYSADCRRESHLELALLPQITALLKILGIDHSSGKLGELFGTSEFADEYAEDQKLWQSRFGVLSPLKQAAGMHRAHRHVQLLELDTPIQYVSLIEGHPILGSRGPWYYVRAASDQLWATHSKYLARIYHTAGLPTPTLAPPNSPAQFHGAQAPTYKEYLDSTRRWIAQVRDQSIKSTDQYALHNCALACLRHFEGALGLRRCRQHLNLNARRREWPFEHLQIADKVVSGELVARILPITRGLQILLTKLKCLFGSEGELPYLDASGTTCSLATLPRTSFGVIRPIFARTGDAAQPGRTAFVNQMLIDGFDERTGYAAAGHSPQMHLWDCHRPESVDFVARDVCEKLTEFFLRHGVDSLAQDLASLLDECCLPAKLPSETVPLPHERKDMPVGISGPADQIGLQLELLVNSPTFQVKPFTRFALFAALRGVPPENLYDYRHYYSTKHFLREQQSGSLHFLMLAADSNAGFMSPYFVPLPSGDGEQIGEIIRACDAVSKTTFGVPTPNKFYTEVVAALSNLGISTTEGLIEECARVRCRWLLPGFVAGQLLGSPLRILNHIDYRDDFELRGMPNPQLVHLSDGSTFLMPHERPLRGEVKCSTRQRLEVRDLPPADIAGRAEIALRILRPDRYAVSTESIKAAAKLVAFNPNHPQSVERHISRLLWNRGLHAVSPPSRVLLAGEIDPLVVAVKQGICDIKPKLARKGVKLSPKDRQTAKQRLQTNLLAAFYAMLLAGLRIGEIKRAFALHVPVAQSSIINSRGTKVLGNEVYLAIPKAKTPAGVRTTSTATCCPPTLRQYVPELQQAVLSIHGAHSAFSEGAMEYILSHALPGKPLTPHCLRRSAIAANQILVMGTPRRNNILTYIAHSCQLGHVSTAVTSCDYAGSSMIP